MSVRDSACAEMSGTRLHLECFSPTPMTIDSNVPSRVFDKQTKNMVNFTQGFCLLQAPKIESTLIRVQVSRTLRLFSYPFQYQLWIAIRFVKTRLDYSRG